LGKPNTVALTIRVAPEIKAAIQKAAEADDRSITVWVERALAAYLRQQGLLKK
jgi:predicted transcriptional regulator